MCVLQATSSSIRASARRLSGRRWRSFEEEEEEEVIGSLGRTVTVRHPFVPSLRWSHAGRSRSRGFPGGCAQREDHSYG
ncbi:hypothetical protein SCOCK_190105 [Actinacidiphila cocklensis]|uniref:Uncharacterized protein n=1 Tax=Actinacidiphila cocklensis TaxID=887465 RepID=A0A9W4GQ52_9ACTN|nr:hypothetical protein SCOCK_190105 [Actinacidiphila cocklensis]